MVSIYKSIVCGCGSSSLFVIATVFISSSTIAVAYDVDMASLGYIH